MVDHDFFTKSGDVLKCQHKTGSSLTLGQEEWWCVECARRAVSHAAGDVSRSERVRSGLGVGA